MSNAEQKKVVIDSSPGLDYAAHKFLVQIRDGMRLPIIMGILASDGAVMSARITNLSQDGEVLALSQMDRPPRPPIVVALIDATGETATATMVLQEGAPH